MASIHDWYIKGGKHCNSLVWPRVEREQHIEMDNKHKLFSCRIIFGSGERECMQACIFLTRMSSWTIHSHVYVGATTTTAKACWKIKPSGWFQTKMTGVWLHANCGHCFLNILVIISIHKACTIYVSTCGQSYTLCQCLKHHILVN